MSGITQRWRKARAGVALVAAYALALQALLASFGVGVMVVRHQLAAISGSLCTPGHGAAAPAPVPPAQYDHADCCILCVGPGPALNSQIDGLMLAVDGGMSSRLVALPAVPRPGMLAWLPGGARAPPAWA